MTDNFQPSEDIFDDVDGHAYEGHLNTDEAEGADEVAGHTMKAHLDMEDLNDVEGHMPLKRGAIEADDTPVEGHAFRHIEEEDTDDTEGHSIRTGH